MTRPPPISCSIAPLSPEAHRFRRDELLRVDARLRAGPRDTCVLSVKGARRAAALDRRLGAARG